MTEDGSRPSEAFMLMSRCSVSSKNLGQTVIISLIFKKCWHPAALEVLGSVSDGSEVGCTQQVPGTGARGHPRASPLRRPVRMLTSTHYTL